MILLKSYRMLENYVKIDFFRHARCLELNKNRSFRAIIIYSSQSLISLPAHHINEKTVGDMENSMELY